MMFSVRLYDALYYTLVSPALRCCIQIQCNYKPIPASADCSHPENIGRMIQHSQYSNAKYYYYQSIISYISGDMGMELNSQNVSQDPHQAQNNVSTSSLNDLYHNSKSLAFSGTTWLWWAHGLPDGWGPKWHGTLWRGRHVPAWTWTTLP